MSDDPADAVSEMQAEAKAAAKAQTADALECIIKAGTLRDTLDILDSAVQEAIFHIGRDGLDVSCVDPSNVHMLEVSLGADAFADTGSGSWAIGLNIQTLSDYLSKADDSDLVSLTFDPEKRRLGIHYGSVNARMASIDPDAIRDEPDRSELDLPNTTVVDSKTLYDGVDLLSMVSDHVAITAAPDKQLVNILGEGDTDDMDIELDEDDLLAGTKLTEQTTSLFSTDYLVSSGPDYPGILNQLPSTHELTIQHGDEFPMIIEYEYASGDGHVTAFLAPRLST